MQFPSSVIILNQSKADAEFYHSLTAVASRTLVMISSKIRLLTQPMSALAGLTSLHGRLLVKFSLQSFKVMNTNVSARVFIHVSIPRRYAIDFASLLMSSLSFFQCCLVVFGHVVSQELFVLIFFHAVQISCLVSPNSYIL